MKTQPLEENKQEDVRKGKTTLVIGASTKSLRYSNRAIRMLRDHGHPVLALGLRKGQVGDVEIENDPEVFAGASIHTVTMYMNAQRQREYHDYIISLRPQRIVFNPGAENPALEALAIGEGIEVLEACTLVMLSLGQF